MNTQVAEVKCVKCQRLFPISVPSGLKVEDVVLYCARHLPRYNLISIRLLETADGLRKGTRIGLRLRQLPAEGINLHLLNLATWGETEWLCNGVLYPNAVGVPLDSATLKRQRRMIKPKAPIGYRWLCQPDRTQEAVPCTRIPEQAAQRGYEAVVWQDSHAFSYSTRRMLYVLDKENER